MYSATCIVKLMYVYLDVADLRVHQGRGQLPNHYNYHFLAKHPITSPLPFAKLSSITITITIT